MKINETPYRTSRNYGINNLEIENEDFCKKLHPFSNFCVKNAQKFEMPKVLDLTTAAVMSEDLQKQIDKVGKVFAFQFEKDCEKPMVLDFNFNEKNDTLVETILFVAKSGVNAQVIVNFQGDVEAYHNGLVKCVCESGAKLEIAVVFDNPKMKNFVTFENVLKKNAKLDFSIIDFAGKISAQKFHASLEGENARCGLKSVYFADKQSVVDLNYHEQIFGQNCYAEIEAVGALKDFAQKNFKGTIDFQKGCKKSVGEENETCLLLSKTAQAKTLPMLLCGEEDVDGKHSAAVGKIDEKTLFYIMSRGLDREEALSLAVKAKFGEMLNKLFDDELKEKISKKLEERLKNEEC